MKIQKNDRLSFIEVLVATKELYELINQEDSEIIRVPLELYSDDNALKDYLSIIVCKKKDRKRTEEAMKKQNHKQRKDLEVPKGSCHITTFYEVIPKSREITFNRNDDGCPIKASFNKEYESIDQFFKSFIRFRNKLIENNEIVKEDDLFQYLALVKHNVKSKRKIANSQARQK